MFCLGKLLDFYQHDENAWLKDGIKKNSGLSFSFFSFFKACFTCIFGVERLIFIYELEIYTEKKMWIHC